MEVIELKNGSFYCINNEDDFSNMLNEQLGGDVAKEFESYLIDKEELDELSEANNELEAENQALKEINSKLENDIAILTSGDNPLNDKLDYIETKFRYLTRYVTELSKVSKAKKVIDVQEVLLQEVTELKKLIGELR